jgi:cell division protein ZapA
MEGDEKKSVRLTIYNQTFSLRVAGDPEDLIRAANEVDELMTTIARSGNMDATRVALLACLHLQDKVHSLESEIGQIKASVEGRSRELAELLDSVVKDG